MSKKNLKKNNLPHYFCNEKQDLIDIQKSEYCDKNIRPMTVKKFRIGIDKNRQPIITIDNVMHFLTIQQFNTFNTVCNKVSEKLNKEVIISE